MTDNSEAKATLRRLILGELKDRLRLSEVDLYDAIEVMYQQARMEFPWQLLETALWGLMSHRRIKRIKTKWDGEYDYELHENERQRLKFSDKRQEVLF